jgi:hypothetical protein
MVKPKYSTHFVDLSRSCASATSGEEVVGEVAAFEAVGQAQGAGR